MSHEFNRRGCVSALAAGLAMLSACATSVGTKPKQYVLVHGAWHGNWAWNAIVPLLEKSGVKVFAPTLTGLAERAGENSSKVNLDTHIQDVLSVLDRNNLTDIVLVGHSYGGAVVTGVCDRRSERISHVVYLDAFLLENGQKVYDFVKPAERLARTRQDTLEKGEGFKAFPPPAAAWGLTGEMAAYVNKRMTTHPAMTNEQPLLLTRGGPYAVPRRTYIDCTTPAMLPFVETKAKVKADARWKYLTVEAGHEVALTHPDLLAKILLDLS